jgi:hypothetical protein
MRVFRSNCRLLAFVAGCVALGGLAGESQAIELKNNSRSTLYVAVASEIDRSVSTRVEGHTFRSQGWFKVEPGGTLSNTTTFGTHLYVMRPNGSGGFEQILPRNYYVGGEVTRTIVRRMKQFPWRVKPFTWLHDTPANANYEAHHKRALDQFNNRQKDSKDRLELKGFVLMEDYDKSGTAVLIGGKFGN